MCGCGCDLAAMLAIEQAKAGHVRAGQACDADAGTVGGGACTCNPCRCGKERADDVTAVTVGTAAGPKDRSGWATFVRAVQGLLLRYADGPGAARTTTHERFEAR